MKTHFNDPECNQLWSSYFKNIRSYCLNLSQRQSEDIENEIKAHLFESFVNQSGTEIEKLKASINKLGIPESYMESWVEERLLEQLSPGKHVKTLWSLSKMNPAKGIKQMMLNLLFGFGYLMAFFLFAVAVLKVFFPENIGFFISNRGYPFIGFVDSKEFTEYLGYWIIPLGLVVSFFLQYLLNKSLKKMVSKK